MGNIRIITWNINGIRASVKKGFYDKVKELNPDILCLQETKAGNDIVEAIAEGLDGYRLYVNSAVKPGYSGTAVFTRIKPLSHKYDMGIEEHDQEGRLITVEYKGFYLVNVYTPNSGDGLKRLDYREKWDNDMYEYLKKLASEKPLIFTGDLNVAHEPIDLARPKDNYNKSAGYTQREIDGFKKFLTLELLDTYRHFNGDKIQYTFWNQRFRARERNVGWRIDYFMVSRQIIEQVKSAYILDEVMGSDHCPAGIEVSRLPAII